MARSTIASVENPPPARRRGQATPWVVLELGLDEAALADALTWARGRAAELLADLDDAELRSLIEPGVGQGAVAAANERDAERDAEVASPRVVEALATDVVGGHATLLDEPEDPSLSMDLSELARLLLSGAALEPAANSSPEPASAPPPPSGADRRTTPRYSLIEPAVVSVASWQELVALYTRDIGVGGMFVESAAPPERDVRVALQLLLPDGAGVLDFEGVVVHVVGPEQAAASGTTPGFGLEFTGLTPERRRALQQLVERAEAAASRPDAQAPTLQSLAEGCRRLIEASGAKGLVPPPPPFGSTPPSRPAASETPQPPAAASRLAKARAIANSSAAPETAEPAAPARLSRTTPPPVHPSPSPVEADVVVAQQR